MNKVIKENPKVIYLLYFASLVSLVATFGSLYFSEIREFIPCEKCWYQRIFMYPFVFILGIAMFQRDVTVRKLVLPLPIIGGCISLIHYLEQKIPGFGGFNPCVSGVPCNIKYINWFGFVTIPFLALTAFTLISISMIAMSRTKRKVA